MIFGASYVATGYGQGCSYSGRGRAGPPTTYDFRLAQFFFFFFFFFLVPGTMFHNRGSIIAQYTLKMTLSGSESLPGHCPWTTQSLALHFVGFTHSACHYYSQLFSTTQIGLATTLATAYVFTLSTGIVQFLLRGTWGQPGVNSYRDCVEIVQKSCNVSAVAVQSPQPPHGNRTEPVRGLCNATNDMSPGYGLTIFPNL